MFVLNYSANVKLYFEYAKYFFKFYFDLFLFLSKGNLKILLYLHSNYILNTMLRIQEVCKEKGITMQILAKKMGISYQALYASIAGNPTIGRLNEIAKVLDCSLTELVQESTTHLKCPCCGAELQLVEKKKE